MTSPRIFRPVFLLVAAVAASLALSACKPPDTVAVLPVLAKAPPWKLVDLAGNEVGAASLRGKVIVVDFWATWCGPCIGEIPGYAELQKKYAADGLVVVGLSVDQASPVQVREFAAKNGMTYRVAMADDATVAAFGGFDAIPTTFLIDRDGNIRHRKVGAMAPAEYEQIVRSVL